MRLLMIESVQYKILMCLLMIESVLKFSQFKRNFASLHNIFFILAVKFQ
jgi:hypothetical protein